jgi:hypothetical protein
MQIAEEQRVAQLIDAMQMGALAEQSAAEQRADEQRAAKGSGDSLGYALELALGALGRVCCDGNQMAYNDVCWGVHLGSCWARWGACFGSHWLRLEACCARLGANLGECLCSLGLKGAH